MSSTETNEMPRRRVGNAAFLYLIVLHLMALGFLIIIVAGYEAYDAIVNGFIGGSVSELIQEALAEIRS